MQRGRPARRSAPRARRRPRSRPPRRRRRLHGLRGRPRSSPAGRRAHAGRRSRPRAGCCSRRRGRAPAKDACRRRREATGGPRRRRRRAPARCPARRPIPTRRSVSARHRADERRADEEAEVRDRRDGGDRAPALGLGGAPAGGAEERGRRDRDSGSTDGEAEERQGNGGRHGGEEEAARSDQGAHGQQPPVPDPELEPLAEQAAPDHGGREGAGPEPADGRRRIQVRLQVEGAPVLDPALDHEREPAQEAQHEEPVREDDATRGLPAGRGGVPPVERRGNQHQHCDSGEHGQRLRPGSPRDSHGDRGHEEPRGEQRVGDLHDARAARGLDVRRGDVDDDVDRPRGDPDEDQSQRQLPDRPRQTGKHRGEGEENERDRHDPRSDAVDDPSGDEHRRKSRQRQGEEGDAELGHGGVDLLLDVRDEHAPGAPVGAEGGEGEERAPRGPHRARRCRAASKSATPAATLTFSDSTAPASGTANASSQARRTPGRRPRPSAPKTSAIPVVRSASQTGVSAPPSAAQAHSCGPLISSR